MITEKSGIPTGIIAYILWGLLPIYWKLSEHIGADIVLAHRIIWSFVFMIVFILITRSWKRFATECKRVLHNKRVLLLISSASVVISLNWLVFIWAVQNEHVVQTSLGYYINPLISILFGVLLLREKLSKVQVVSCIIAGIAVCYLTFSYGIFPWISLALAVTFALYGLLKKLANIEASFSLAIETMIITPITLIYLFSMHGVTIGFTSGAMNDNLLLLFSGIATAVPLLLFGSAVLHIPLSMLGFLQYIAPTIMLFIGVFLYDEVFTNAHLVTFILIWFSLILYMSASFLWKRNRGLKN